MLYRDEGKEVFAKIGTQDLSEKVKKYLRKDMSYATELRYLATHEWGRIDEEGILTVGISEHAQDLLGDIVFVELPDIGKELDAEEESAIVESVKAASDVYAPLSGEVIEVNEKLLDEPEIVNSSPLEDGWFFKIKLNDASSFENLMTEEEYNATCEE